MSERSVQNSDRIRDSDVRAGERFCEPRVLERRRAIGQAARIPKHEREIGEWRRAFRSIDEECAAVETKSHDEQKGRHWAARGRVASLRTNVARDAH